MTITVRPVNDPPAASDGSANTLEGASVAINLGALADDLETADANLIYVIDTGPGHGSLSGSGPSVTYAPATDYFGPDSFTFHVEDRGDPDNCGAVGPACAAALASSTHLVDITVDAVNDAPSFALPASPDQTVFEDAGAQSLAAFATGISAGPANETGQMLTFHVSNNNNALFSAQPALDPTTGDLTFTPAANANGAATVSVYLMDDGGTANGGADTSATQTFLIQVTPVNDVAEFRFAGQPGPDRPPGCRRTDGFLFRHPDECWPRRRSGTGADVLRIEQQQRIVCRAAQHQRSLRQPDLPIRDRASPARPR